MFEPAICGLLRIGEMLGGEKQNLPAVIGVNERRNFPRNPASFGDKNTFADDGTNGVNGNNGEFGV